MNMDMKVRIGLFAFCLCTLFPLSACKSQAPTIGAVDYQSDESHILKIKGINREQAIAIANDDAGKSNKSLSALHVVSCELVRTWLIIFDGGGPEYVIDKTSGKIIRAQTIPQGGDDRTKGNLAPNHKEIDKEQAIEIAKKAARQAYGPKGVDIDQFVILPCEQAKVWRVIFDYRLDPGQDTSSLPNAGFPKYVIDKRTGEILYKELN